jgi:hypothetical protein
MKKSWLIVLGALGLGIIGAGTYLLITSGKTESPKAEVVQEAAPKPQLLTWDDPAGFTFSYPDGVVINKHDEDIQNYAHIEMTNSAHPGALTIWAKDLPSGVTDTASWIKKDASLAAQVAFDTTLGSIEAKKILITSPAKKMVVGTVTDGLLFYIESTLADEAYWQQAINTVTGSFVFKPVDKPVQSGSEPVQDEPVDEEEVLQ